MSSAVTLLTLFDRCRVSEGLPGHPDFMAPRAAPESEERRYRTVLPRRAQSFIHHLPNEQITMMRGSGDDVSQTVGEKFWFWFFSCHPAAAFKS